MKEIKAKTRWLCVISLTIFMVVVNGSCADMGEEAEQGVQALADYGCRSCHTIPGVQLANGIVGPPLDFWGSRSYISGTLVNNPDNLAIWLMNPQSIDPATVMPQMGVSEADAHNIGSYLYTLHADSGDHVSIRGFTGHAIMPLPHSGH